MYLGGLLFDVGLYLILSVIKKEKPSLLSQVLFFFFFLILEMGGLAIRDEAGIAKSLWVKSTNESVFAIYTPYILSLASGKLDSGSFLHCISQDLRFLQASAEA